MAYKLEKLILGNFGSFIEAGTEVGDEENVVSADWFPEASEDLAAYSSIGSILEAEPEAVVEEDEDYEPSPAGGYNKVTEETVVQDILKLSLKCHSEPIWRMVWGLKNKIANGVAQTPFGNKSARFVEGWLIFEQRAGDGVTKMNAALYGRLRIDSAPKWSKDPTKPAVRFEILYSSIATSEPAAIV